jgi:hypothetical protein
VEAEFLHVNRASDFAEGHVKEFCLHGPIDVTNQDSVWRNARHRDIRAKEMSQTRKELR